MQAISRSIGAVMIALTIPACDDDQLFDPEAMGVEIEAGVRESFTTGEDIVLLTVENRGTETVYYYGVTLETRRDGGWEPFDPPPIRTGQPTPIESDAGVSVERHIHKNSFDPPTLLTAGEYRFMVFLSVDGGLTSADAVASNTFHIDG